MALDTSHFVPAREALATPEPAVWGLVLLVAAGVLLGSLALRRFRREPNRGPCRWQRTGRQSGNLAAWHCRACGQGAHAIAPNKPSACFLRLPSSTL